MGIQLGGPRRRRSYADYGRRRNRRGGSDPFRILIYLILIGGLVWFYFNRERFNTSDILENVAANSPNPRPNDATVTPTLEPTQFAEVAEQAYDEGDLETALANYQQAANSAPNTIEYHVAVARLLLIISDTRYGDNREEMLSLAMEAADRAILADPEAAEGYAIKAMALDWNDRAEEASLQAQRAIEINPDYAPAYAYLAEAYVDLTRWEQAEEVAEQAIELDPFDVDVQRNYAYVFENFQQYDVAAQHYEQAIAINPNLPHLHLSLARAYRELGRLDDAIDEYTLVSTMLPDNPISYFELGWTYHTAIGDPNTALEYLEQAVELDPNYTRAWVRIGTIHYLNGTWSDAVTALQRALELGEETADVYLALGVSLANLAECNDAAGYLRRAQELAGEEDERVQEIVQTALDQCAEAGVNLATPTPSVTSQFAPPGTPLAPSA